jgi:hypothetical protein
MLSLPVLAAGPVPNGDGSVDTGLRAVLPPPAAGTSSNVVLCCRAVASAPLSAVRNVAATAASAAPSVVCVAAAACETLVGVLQSHNFWTDRIVTGELCFRTAVHVVPVRIRTGIATKKTHKYFSLIRSSQRYQVPVYKYFQFQFVILNGIRNRYGSELV